jgi:hypothetical protein
MGHSLTYRPRGVFPATHEDRTVPPTPIIWSQAHIRPQHRSRLAKQILEILPPDSVRQLQGISVRTTLLPRMRLTFPTKRFTLPSAPTAEGRRLVINGVMDRLTATRVRVSRSSESRARAIAGVGGHGGRWWAELSDTDRVRGAGLRVEERSGSTHNPKSRAGVVRAVHWQWLQR